MRLALALDTSTRRGSVALGFAGGTGLEVLGDVSLEVSATHSETVLPAIDRLLGEAGTKAADLDVVVVGAGPGSFTGVRIGAALARGLCFPDRAELFAYSSLAAIAAGAGVAGRVCALLDARRGQVYAAGYSVRTVPHVIPAESADPAGVGGLGGGVAGLAGLETRFEPRAGALDDLLDELDPAAWRFAGVLRAEQRSQVEAAGGRVLPPERGRPTGTGLLQLLHAVPEVGRVEDPAHWEPEYVRGSSAERRVGRC